MTRLEESEERELETRWIFELAESNLPARKISRITDIAQNEVASLAKGLSRQKIHQKTTSITKRCPCCGALTFRPPCLACELTKSNGTKNGNQRTR